MLESLKHVLSQHKDNLYRILSLIKYERLAKNRESKLGSLWDILSPIIQIGTYWFVFGLGIRGGKPVGDIPYMMWMLGGLIPWFFLSACIRTGTSSILSKVSVLEKMNFPTSILITTSVLNEMISHLIMIGIVYVIFLIQGYHPNITNINLIYYLFCATFFSISFGLVFSVLTMLARDVKNIVTSSMRMLFYITPVLWTTDKLPVFIQGVMKLNPLSYIIEGYRASLFPSLSPMNALAGLYFWAITICMFMFGCKLIHKYRYKFLDLS